MTDTNESDQLVRQVTHTQFAPVARMMGYTVQGLKELLASLRLDSNWQMIGVTRRTLNSPTVQRVNARVVNGKRGLDEMNRVVVQGKVQFSIGDAAYELSGDAKAARELRRSIAEGVAKVGEMRRGPINSRFNYQPDGAVDGDSGDDQDEQAPEVMIITPVAPRGPHPFRSC